MQDDSSAAHVACILNAAYLVRHYRRAVTRAQRAQAIAEMARAVRAALARSADDEATLYAVAQGLHDPLDPRFHF